MTYGARPSGWLGWIWFAAVMMILVGVFNVITGLSAILRGALYVQTGDQVLVLNLPAWGWIHLILGVLLIAAGIALIAGQTWARVVAVVLAALNAIEHMLFIPAYPWWSLIVIAIDILVIYALVVHGHEMERTA